MAFFYNPKGEVIPRAGRFDLAKNAELNIGTKDSDTFLFDKVDRDEVTVGMGGNNVFNGGIPMPGKDFDLRWYSWLDEKHHKLLMPEFAWEPWKSGNDIGHGGSGTDMKFGYRADIGVAHGGHYQSPLQFWMQPDDKFYMGANKEVTGWKIGKIVKDSDGKGYTADLLKVSLEGHDKNPILAGKLVDLIPKDQGTYYDRPGHNIFEQARVDFDSKRGPTADDVMDFITGKQADSHHWDVLQ